MPDLTIFYAADVHGSEKCFRKFVNAARFYSADLLILGGDLTGKAFVPIIRRTDGAHHAELFGHREVCRTEEELIKLEERVRFNGFYPFRTTAAELELLENDHGKRVEHFKRIISDCIRRWVDFADERLDGRGITCLIMPGNDDDMWVEGLLAQSKVATNPEGRVLQIAGYQVLSLGYSNYTPWHSPREISENEIHERIEAMASDLRPDEPAIFNLHVPPYGTNLDLAPEIREDLTLIGGPSARMVPVGSHAVRAAIEKYQPLLALHGHIHESRGSIRLGRTLCLNPGSEYNVGVLRGVIVKLRENKVRSFQFVAA